MLDLTFGEQVKIILSRKGMTIKELAEIIEERTGKKMSRQNLTQRLGRDNFQEQDMRMIAEILECPFHLSILGEAKAEEEKENRQAAPTEAELTLLAKKKKRKEKKIPAERDITIGELMDIHHSLDELETAPETEEPEADIAAADDSEPDEVIPEEEPQETIREEAEEKEEEPQEELQKEAVQESEKPVKKQRGSWRDFFQRRVRKEDAKTEQEVQEEKEENAMEVSDEISEALSDEAEEKDRESKEQNSSEEEIENRQAEGEMDLPGDPEEEDLEKGEVNPYTGHEYETNTVRMHPKRIGYVQVYDRSNHQWTDMTEWAFLGYQERKKALLGNDYEPPIYLD